jgi:hypothetical protein
MEFFGVFCLSTLNPKFAMEIYVDFGIDDYQFLPIIFRRLNFNKINQKIAAFCSIISVIRIGKLINTGIIN